MSIEILTKADAAKRPAGLGRSDPNQHPKLPDPRGRFEFSWNPLTMISRLCGPRFRYTILCGLCIVIIIIVLYNLLYSFGGSVLANKLTG